MTNYLDICKTSHSTENWIKSTSSLNGLVSLSEMAILTVLSSQSLCLKNIRDSTCCQHSLKKQELSGEMRRPPSLFIHVCMHYLPCFLPAGCEEEDRTQEGIRGSVTTPCAYYWLRRQSRCYKA